MLKIPRYGFGVCILWTIYEQMKSKGGGKSTNVNRHSLKLKLSRFKSSGQVVQVNEKLSRENNLSKNNEL